MPKKKSSRARKVGGLASGEAKSPKQREFIRLLEDESRSFARPGTRKFSSRAMARKKLIKIRGNR